LVCVIHLNFFLRESVNILFQEMVSTIAHRLALLLEELLRYPTLRYPRFLAIYPCRHLPLPLLLQNEVLSHVLMLIWHGFKRRYPLISCFLPVTHRRHVLRRQFIPWKPHQTIRQQVPVCQRRDSLHLHPLNYQNYQTLRRRMNKNGELQVALKSKKCLYLHSRLPDHQGLSGLLILPTNRHGDRSQSQMPHSMIQ